MQTCTKLGIAFWDYLGARLGIQAQRMGRFCQTSSVAADVRLELLRPGFCRGYRTDA